MRREGHRTVSEMALHMLSGDKRAVCVQIAAEIMLLGK